MPVEESKLNTPLSLETGMTKNGVVDLMKSSKSEEDWEANCGKVKESFSGKYKS